MDFIIILWLTLNTLRLYFVYFSPSLFRLRFFFPQTMQVIVLSQLSLNCQLLPFPSYALYVEII